VVFDVTNERLRRYAERRSAAQYFSPRKRLPLIQETVFRGGNKFLRCAKVIGEISFVATGQRHDGAVMKIVIPHPVQTVAALDSRPRHPGFLQIVLRDQNDRTRPGGFARGTSDSSNNVFF
jgi:hypothetical protein